MKRTAPLIVFALLVAACGTAGPINPLPDNPSGFSLEYRVTGGFAGSTIVDLVVDADGNVFLDGVSVPIRMGTLAKKLFVDDITATGATHDSDVRLNDGPDGLADGFTHAIVIGAGDGRIELAAYGLGESPDSYLPELAAVVALLDSFIERLRDPLAPGTYRPIDGALIVVEGFVMVEDDRASLCTHLSDASPPQCGTRSVPVEGLDPATLNLEVQSGVAWSASPVILIGVADEAALSLR